MPRIYLSPSLQEYNPFYGGGSEEEVMNLIADAMEPYLAADGIEYLRNAPEMTLGQAIAITAMSIFTLPSIPTPPLRLSQAQGAVPWCIIMPQALMAGRWQS